MARSGFGQKLAAWRGTFEEPGRLENSAPALPLGARLSVIRNLRDFASLEAEWRRLEASALSGRHAFQTFDWLSNWLKTYGNPADKPQLAMAAGFKDNRLVFAWPLMRTRTGPLTVLRWASEPFSQYGDILVARDENPEAWMADALLHFSQMRGVDAIRLRHVRADAAAAPFLRTTFRYDRLSEQAPWLDLTGFADEAAYNARYTSVQRKRRKKIRKALEDDLGPVEFRRLFPGSRTDEAIARAIAEKSRWIDERGRQNRILGCSRLAGFLASLSSARPPGAELVVTELSAGGRPVSWEIGIRHQATHYAYITSHPTELTGYSPARLHMDLSQRLALTDGMKAFDLMVPNDAYKESWCSARTLTEDYHLPLSPAGWAYGALYLENLRPFLRDRYYRMPPALLKLLKPVTGH